MYVSVEVLKKDLKGSSNIAVGLSSEFLSAKGIREESFARLILGDVSHVVQLASLGDEAKDGVVYLPPMLSLHFGIHLLPFLKPPERERKAKLILLSIHPRIAAKVELKSVGCPVDQHEVAKTKQNRSTAGLLNLFSHQRMYTIPLVLHRHDSGPRYVTEGDVLTATLGKVNEWERIEDVKSFRVTSIEPKGYSGPMIVQPTLTKVFVEGDFCSGFVPPSYPSLSDREGEKDLYWDPVIGPLLPHWTTVAKALAAALERKREADYRLGLLLHGHSGKTTAVKFAARALGVKYVVLDCLDIDCSSIGNIYQRLKALGERARDFAPCLFVLRNLQHISHQIGSLTRERQQGTAILASLWHELTNQTIPQKSLILVGTCDNPQSVASVIRHAFTMEIYIPPLDKQEKRLILRHHIHRFRLKSSIQDINESVDLVAERLHPGSPRDLIMISCRLLQLTKKISQRERRKIEIDDVEVILQNLQKRKGPEATVVEVPRVEWSDIGGLDNVKAIIRQTVELPIKHRSLFANGLQKKRLGVLLYGPPGVGKTLLAKAIATECKTKFMSIKGPELLNMYIGETERLVRDLFSRAKKASPCVLFFDELDAFVPPRGQHHGKSAMDRVVSQFLAELDEVSAGQHDVFVFGATNRIDLIDSSLLRPGRLDQLVEVGLPRDPSAKLSILESLTRKFVLSDDVDLEEVASKLEESTSGADIYAVCSNAWTSACKRLISQIKIGEERREVVVRHRDFLEAIE